MARKLNGTILYNANYTSFPFPLLHKPRKTRKTNSLEDFFHFYVTQLHDSRHTLTVSFSNKLCLVVAGILRSHLNSFSQKSIEYGNKEKYNVTKCPQQLCHKVAKNLTERGQPNPSDPIMFYRCDVHTVLRLNGARGDYSFGQTTTLCVTVCLWQFMYPRYRGICVHIHNSIATPILSP